MWWVRHLRSSVSASSTSMTLPSLGWAGRLSPRALATSGRAGAESPGTRVMPQVDVDEPSVRRQLGPVQMTFVKQAERDNAQRATRHKKFRRKDWYVAAICLSVAAAIYSYTIFAIKQETFLDDFDMPDPMEMKEAKA
ncbi:uncharacterized protein LOC131883975 [Tigriopus californicus]|uniref:uncharacterized protein LOC131883975 n=1 Tax=Tigriopus californicus TaxID=6832 RepID=UPI0027DA4D0B|nr:uncharacterized protein LOC131883975 [Tigriopus californicus]|eukprot:TCALIF_00303-PA protein Name:"Similar to Ccdc56 Cytochrome c oxidase assembly factor 3, mitochondrial (Drosophila melanogaster)" AED:0.71 eAED:0.71 QI:0/-1/0/1/-1/1/1/0/137